MAARTVRFDRAALETVIAACEGAGETEACGVLLGTLDPIGVERAVAVENAADAPDRRYAIPAARVRSLDGEAEALGLHVVGFYHSHPGSATPSAADLAGAWPGYVYLIVGRGQAGAEARAWRLAADRCDFEEALIRTGTKT
ncbi:MAG: M67 family metallopeptidase [Gemmatimonadota bacterium]